MNDHQALLEANRAFYRAFERKDIDGMASVWSQGTGVLCIHPGRQSIQGWQDVRASWQTIFKNTEYFEIELGVISAEVSGTLGYVVLSEQLFQVVRGRRLEAKSMATNVFEKLGDRWYLVHHHGSPVAGR